MKCPDCGTEVFDIYTTEERIKQLYHDYTTLNWARNRMRIFAETIEDRLKPNNGLPPVNIEWMAKEIRSIADKMKTAVNP